LILIAGSFIISSVANTVPGMCAKGCPSFGKPFYQINFQHNFNQATIPGLKLDVGQKGLGIAGIVERKHGKEQC
jgi:hypothetical protein